MTSGALDSGRDQALVVDMHMCPSRRPQADLSLALERCRADGLTGVVVNVGESHEPLEAVIRTIASWRSQIAACPDRYLQVVNPSDFDFAARNGLLAVAFDIEGAFSIGEQLDLIEMFFTLGVRWMSLVYNRRNLAGGGCHDEPDEGLSGFGRAIVAEMDRVGMVKCCSHTGYRTVREILEMSTKPAIFSHSNPRNLADHPRNIPDDLMLACAASGGVTCINGVNVFLGAKEPRAADLFRHVDYAVELVGAEHVGIGSDFMFPGSSSVELRPEERKELWPLRYYQGGITVTPISAIAELRHLMEQAGYPEEAVVGILGQNVLRVFSEVCG